MEGPQEKLWQEAGKPHALRSISHVFFRPMRCPHALGRQEVFRSETQRRVDEDFAPHS